MKEYLQSAEEVLKAKSSSPAGLSSAEAEQRLAKYGKNKLAEAKKETLLHKLLGQFTDPMILILIAAAVISGVTAVLQNESFADVIIIMAVVIINAVLGVVQESKAEKAIEALQQIAAATSKVIRDGRQITIRSDELVPGDIVVLEAGDSIPADCRLIECASLKCEEAALTGESVPVLKTANSISPADNGEVPLGDRKNMVYMGSTAVYGRGKAVVVDTGMETEMGKIANALTLAKEEETPLQLKLNQLSKILSFLVLGICVVIFGIDLVRMYPNFSGEGILNTFMVAVSLAVAAIPEGLAAVVTIVLSIGVTNMSRRNAVIRKLTAVETLGCTQIICSDKTGTLTQNKMTVVDHYGDNEQLLAESFALCTDAVLPRGKTVSEGDPTQTAVVDYAAKLGLPKYELEERAPRVGEIPFDSGRKMMTTVHQKDGGYIQHTTGAPDVVIGRCTKILVEGAVIPMTDELRVQLAEANKHFADRALRVLAAAYRTYDAAPTDYTPEVMESDLIFLGLAGMIDPVRPEVIDAVKECRAAGIRPIMITGDHRDTAAAIARQLGILREGDLAITGAELNGISDEELEATIEKYSVYARVQPEHKVRIVNAWRAHGMITAMTGDGVNDAPSIKSSDIGVGMGITGTDVTKNVADMVLADDNFATIVAAVEEGRRIYDNIRKSIQFLLSSNLAEVLSIFVATLLGFTILEPVHLLWINLITDCLPAIALGMEKSEPDIMQRPPRNSKDGIFAGGMGIHIALQGLVIAGLTVLSYFVGHRIEAGSWALSTIENGFSADGTTMAFLTLSLIEIFHSFNMRSLHGSIFKLKTQNVWLWASIIGAFVLTTAVIYLPGLSDAFGFAHISLVEYLIAAAMAFAIIPIVEITKLVTSRVFKHKQN